MVTIIITIITFFFPKNIGNPLRFKVKEFTLLLGVEKKFVREKSFMTNALTKIVTHKKFIYNPVLHQHVKGIPDVNLPRTRDRDNRLPPESFA